MEHNLLSLQTSTLLEKFGAGSHKPGSGSAAALLGILAAQLLRTVIGLTKDRNQMGVYTEALPALLEGQSKLVQVRLPILEKLFQQDSEQFDLVINLRMERDAAEDPVVKKRKADEGVAALIPATEYPLDIADQCIEIARLGIDVFDRGFKSARGDSGVAVSAAVGAIAGCLAIIDLNLLSFGEEEWTESIRDRRDSVRAEYGKLQRDLADRQSNQALIADRHGLFNRELNRLAGTLKGKKYIPDSEIEGLATSLQRLLWRNRDLVWKGAPPSGPFKVLNPEKALKCLGFEVDRPVTLGNFTYQGTHYEVAGQIDQVSRVVSVSKQFEPEVRNFTAAHELGHSLLHTQQVLHRDRPLDGRVPDDNLPREERQANKFASYFLMPEKLVRATFRKVYGTEKFRVSLESAIALKSRSVDGLLAQCRSARGLARILAGAGFYHITAFRPLADQFGVSVEAMAIRLEELDLFEFPQR